MAKNEKRVYILKPFKPVKKAKAASLDRTDLAFCDDPAPKVIFEGRSFCLTGIFEFKNGDRNKCDDAIRARGGFCRQHPSHNLDYLVIGTFVEPAWVHKGYGRKIEAALELKTIRANCKIISEAHWLKSLQAAPELPIEKHILATGQSGSNQLALLQHKLDEMQKDQKSMVGILQDELAPSVFRKISKRFRKAGIGI